MKKENLFYSLPGTDLTPASFSDLTGRLLDWIEHKHKCILVMSDAAKPCMASFMLGANEVIVLGVHELSDRILFHIFTHNRPLFLIKSYLGVTQSLEELRKSQPDQKRLRDGAWNDYGIYKNFGPLLRYQEPSELIWWPGRE